MAWLRVNHLHLIEKVMEAQEAAAVPNQRSTKKNPSYCTRDWGLPRVRGGLLTPPLRRLYTAMGCSGS